MADQEWIEAPNRWGIDHVAGNDDDDDHVPSGAVLFQTDPRQTFRFDVTTNATTSTTTTLHLSGYKLDSANTDQSTGVTLWQAAILLGEYLQENPSLVERKSVLELGAGLGLCGIVAHHLRASRSFLTDGDKFALEKLRYNIEQNAISTATIECRRLFWGQTFPAEDEPLFDVILGADVIYGWESFEPLLDTVVAWMKDDGQFLLSWKTRYNGVPVETIQEAAKARNLSWNEVSEGIYSLRFDANFQERQKQTTV